VLGHLVPREMKVQHSQSLKSMSDEELDAAIEYLVPSMTLAPSPACAASIALAMARASSACALAGRLPWPHP
jgi:hypothetical protein